MTDDAEYRRILANARFIKMLAANDKLTQKSKISALKSMIQKKRESR